MDNQIATTKSCPVCGETVKVAARKCIHCSEFIDERSRPDSSKGRWPAWTGFNGKTLWEWMTVLIFPALLGLAGIWVALEQYQFEVRQEESQEQTAVAGVTATSQSNLATLEAALALQATLDAEHTATRSVVTAEAQSTELAVVAAANVRAAEASGSRARILIASENATVQAEDAIAAVAAVENAINYEQEAIQATQVAGELATAQARITADSVVLEKTLTAVELPTLAETPVLTPTLTPTPMPSATPFITPTSIALFPTDKLLFGSDRLVSESTASESTVSEITVSEGAVLDRLSGIAGSHLFIMDGKGGNIEQVTSGLGAEPSYSVNANAIAFTRHVTDGTSSLYWMALDKRNEIQLDKATNEQESLIEVGDAAISPDGRQVLFTSYNGASDSASVEFNLFSVDAQETQQLSCDDLETTWRKGGPTWSPNSETFVFVVHENGIQGDSQAAATVRPDESRPRNITADGPANIWLFDVASSQCTPLTNTLDEVNLYPNWSPDGEQLVFVSNRTGRFTLFTMNADGSNQQPWPNAPVSDRITNISHPTWSLDGKWLAFTGVDMLSRGVVGPNSKFDIFVMSVSGESLTNLTRGNGNNWHPVWVEEKSSGLAQ
ncbi:MAG: hypothetical protein AAF702_10270 [Chloroflexota bacterium]